jgi:predicted TIM-barrel fold metal-dependent hydrolase
VTVTTTDTTRPGIVDGHYLLITADSHGGGNHEQYREYLDPEWRDEFDAWRNRYKNPFQDLHGHRRVRNWDDEMRWDEQETDGTAAEVIFPNTVPPFFPTGAVIAGPPSPEEFPRRLAGIRAHNRWLADFVSQAPERRAGIAQIFLNDVDEAVRDVQWAKEHGLRGGVLLPGRPDDCTWVAPLVDPVYDPLWAACQDLDVTITHHGGQGSPDYGKYPGAPMLWVAETNWFSHRALTHLLVGGVFERFPGLRFVVTEQGCSWVPSTIAMLDGFWHQMRAGRVGELNAAPDLLPHAPSEYFNRNCFVGVSFPSPGEARAMRKVGLERVMWGSDYPHHEGSPPYTREALRRAFSDWEPDELAPVLSENAAAVYGFDLEVLAPIAARVGPTVDELRVPLDEVPKDSGSPAFTRP